MRKTLFLKILKTYLLTIFLITISFFFLSREQIKRHYIGNLVEKLKSVNYTISLKLKDIYNSSSKLNYLIEDIKQNLKIRVTIINSKGVVLADTAYPPKLMDNHLNRPEVQDAIKRGYGESIRYSTTLRQEMIYVATLVNTNNDFLVLRTSYHLKTGDILNYFWRQSIKLGVVVVLLSIMFAFLTSYSITEPLSKVVEAIKKVASGNFDTKIYIKKTDEFKVLSESFNLMVCEVSKLIKDISQQSDRIKNIFSSIQESVVLLNTDGKILMYNEKFEQLCKISPLEKYYWETLVSYEFNDLIKRVLEQKKNFTEEISIQQKTYLCSMSFISEKELFVLLYDITEYKQLQSIKKELISNIIHELKTPLTSIKGFAETLHGETKNKIQKYYLEIILSNTDRLINIINDLTTLALLEQKEIKLDVGDVDLKEVVYTIEKLFEYKIKQKNLQLIFDLKDGLKPIKADKFRIEQMLINLVDNSVRYTEQGYIKLSIFQDEDFTIIEVEDTGIGIPKEYHSRVFERFFVVDKARSKQTGGTGLGLAIVKHIVELHKGKIFLESQVGVGTKFRVLLPSTF
ncbi:MAG: ATP-binding protein [Endomicrobia bacterium]|nr:ATP-binding protein [Endomicrobiia bacterium]